MCICCVGFISHICGIVCLFTWSIVTLIFNNTMAQTFAAIYYSGGDPFEFSSNSENEYNLMTRNIVLTACTLTVFIFCEMLR